MMRLCRTGHTLRLIQLDHRIQHLEHGRNSKKSGKGTQGKQFLGTKRFYATWQENKLRFESRGSRSVKGGS